jgi:type II secretion system (T2SS) protein B
MSYILDALKRAERDRHLTHVPTLATIHASARPTRPRWLWVGGGVLLVNAIVVILLLRAAPVVGPTSTPSPAPPAAAPPPADVQKSPQPQPTATESSPATVPRSAPPAPQTPFAALKLEMVVNADDPAERAVYISGRRYVTGESLERGAMIESIAPDAVVLRWAGQRYLLRWEHPPTPLGR